MRKILFVLQLYIHRVLYVIFSSETVTQKFDIFKIRFCFEINWVSSLHSYNQVFWKVVFFFQVEETVGHGDCGGLLRTDVTRREWLAPLIQISALQLNHRNAGNVCSLMFKWLHATGTGSARRFRVWDMRLWDFCHNTNTNCKWRLIRGARSDVLKILTATCLSIISVCQGTCRSCRGKVGFPLFLYLVCCYI